MFKISESQENMESELKGYSIRLPEKFHNELKADAALLGTTKDEYFRQLLVLGRKNLKKK